MRKRISIFCVIGVMFIGLCLTGLTGCRKNEPQTTPPVLEEKQDEEVSGAEEQTEEPPYSYLDGKQLPDDRAYIESCIEDATAEINQQDHAADSRQIAFFSGEDGRCIALYVNSAGQDAGGTTYTVVLRSGDAGTFVAEWYDSASTDDPEHENVLLTAEYDLECNPVNVIQTDWQQINTYF